MNLDPSANSQDTDSQRRPGQPQADGSQMQADLLAAIHSLEQQQDQLRVMLEDLSATLRARDLSPDRAADRQIARLETRMRGIEQRTDHIAGQLTGILESRIWRTLVKAAALLLRFRGERPSK